MNRKPPVFLRWESKRETGPDDKGHVWRRALCKEICGIDGSSTHIFAEHRCVKCGWRAPDVRPKPNCDERVAALVMES